jgi:3-oxoacyl-[acyl-carrier protein] reductase
MKKIILTGASDGLGKAFGMLCISKGISIVSLGRSKPSYSSVHIPIDLTQQDSINSAIEQIENEHSDFDVLVNCAGIHSAQPQGEIVFEDLEKLYATNILGPIYLTSRLIPLIKKNNADILNIGSSAGTKGMENLGAYSSSKWALRGVSANLQAELKNTPCRVIQLNPGGFKSDIYKKSNQDIDTSKYMNPEDIAKIMLFTLELPKSVEISEAMINRKVS